MAMIDKYLNEMEMYDDATQKSFEYENTHAHEKDIRHLKMMKEKYGIKTIQLTNFKNGLCKVRIQAVDGSYKDAFGIKLDDFDEKLNDDVI